MALRGTLDTFALPEVLRLIGTGAKTGELQVTAGGMVASLWFDAGEVAGARRGATSEAEAVVVELLREHEGEFVFQSGEAPAGERKTVDEVIGAAQATVAEWRAVEEVVPSTDMGLELLPCPPESEVVLTGAQWSVVAAAAPERTVTALAAHLGVPELDAARLVKGLVEAGLVRVVPAVRPAESAPTRPSQQPTPAAIAEAEPAPDAPAAALVRHLAALSGAGDEAGDPPDAAPGHHGGEDGAGPAAEPASTPVEDDPTNRGLLLKFLSSVRS